MKRIMSLILAVLFAISICGCGKGESSTGKAEDTSSLDSINGMSSIDHGLFDASAKVISENAETTRMNDDVVSIVVPFDTNSDSDGLKDQINEKIATAILSIQQIALESTDYKMCVILFENSDENVVFGFTVTESGTNYFETSGKIQG